MLKAETELGSVNLEGAERGSVPPRAKRLRLSYVRALGLLLPTAMLGLWALSSARGWVAPQILPPPARVGATLLEQVDSGELFLNLAISLARVAGGFVVGGLVGALLGVAMGLSRRAEDYLYPSFKAVSQVPVLGWLPLAMMLLGIGESLKVAIIAQATLVPIALNVLAGIRSVPAPYIEVARAFKFTRAQLLKRVIFPASVPALFVGLRGGLTQAWLSLVTVELLASSEGLGFMIVWGRQLFQLDLVLSAIVLVGAVGLALDKALEYVESRLLSWRPDVRFDGSVQRRAS
jgi:sulfonate transport system permease protein